MSSGAEYLTPSPDDTVFETVFSVASSTTLAIPKSQTSGSPLPARGQLGYVVGCERGTYLVRDKHVFLYASSQ